MGQVLPVFLITERTLLHKTGVLVSRWAPYLARGLAMGLISMSLASCTSLPPASPPAPAALAPAATAARAPSTPTARPTADSATPNTSAVPEDEARVKLAQDLERHAKMMGYHVQKRADKVVYCREEGTIGTRFTRSVCVTPEGLAEALRQAQEVQDALQKGNACVGAACATH